MKTILLSTSSLWNCGDDFIREGLMEILQLKADVRILWWNRGYGIKDSYANDLDVNLPLIDYFIIAGTPEWVYKNERIYKYCLKKEIPLSIIGVGTNNLFNRSQARLMKKVAQSGLCEAALARDRMAAQCLRNLGFSNVEIIADLAFFNKIINHDKVLNIIGWRKLFGFGFEFSFKCRQPYRALYSFLVDKVKNRGNAKKKYDELMLQTFHALPEPKMVIVHDNREVCEAKAIFGNEYVFYSSDFREIFKRYAMARTYIGSRIHGAIPSLIHGASVQLVYTSQKARVLEDSVDIFSGNFKDIREKAKVIYYPDRLVSLEQLPGFSDKEALRAAIIKEKERIRLLLTSQRVLKDFMQ
jgi:polysaccharide pyruvyl transferase WcaK-like protein